MMWTKPFNNGWRRTGGGSAACRRVRRMAEVERNHRARGRTRLRAGHAADRRPAFALSFRSARRRREHRCVRERIVRARGPEVAPRVARRCGAPSTLARVVPTRLAAVGSTVEYGAGSWNGHTAGRTGSAGCSCAGRSGPPTTKARYTAPVRTSPSRVRAHWDRIKLPSPEHPEQLAWRPPCRGATAGRRAGHLPHASRSALLAATLESPCGEDARSPPNHPRCFPRLPPLRSAAVRGSQCSPTTNTGLRGSRPSSTAS